MTAAARLPDPAILDGATGTELGRRGVTIDLPLWSAQALLEEHGRSILAGVHRDYLAAGADAITACTFRTHCRSLAKAGLGGRARELTRRAVEIALQARDAESPRALVLGSVAPLEDCYRPDLVPAAPDCRAEHEAMIAHLLEAGVDLVLIETMISQREALAAAGAAERAAPGRWMISFCCAEAEAGRPGVLLSGEPLVDLLPELTGAAAIGVNCVWPDAAVSHASLLRRLIPAGAAVRLMAYANIGRADPRGHWVCTDAVDPERYAAHAARWLEAGASIVGGCCGTTPRHIGAIRRMLSSRGGGFSPAEET